MVTEENTAVSFHGKEKSEELGLEVSLVFFTVSSSISHKSSGQDVSVSRTGPAKHDLCQFTWMWLQYK